MKPEKSKTRSSLISGLKSKKDWAWEEFDRLYRPRLIGWARSYGLSQHDADELVSELIKNLVQHMDQFQYDRNQSFRAYMRTMLQNLISESSRKKARFGRVFSIAEKHDRPSEPTSSSILDEICKAELETIAIFAQNEILDQLPEVDHMIWIALMTKAGTPDELAAEFGISRASLYRVKSRVNAQMQRRYMELSGDDG